MQIRTHLQSVWANAYEAAADALGREIRYDALPVDDEAKSLVVSLREISTVQIVDLEAARNEHAHRDMLISQAHVPGSAPLDVPREELERLRALARIITEDEIELHAKLELVRQLFRTLFEQT